MQLMILSHVSCLCLCLCLCLMSLSHVSLMSLSVSCLSLMSLSVSLSVSCLMSLPLSLSHVSASVSVSCFCLCLTHAPEFQTFKQFAHMQLVFWELINKKHIQRLTCTAVCCLYFKTKISYCKRCFSLLVPVFPYRSCCVE